MAPPIGKQPQFRKGRIQQITLDEADESLGRDPSSELLLGKAPGDPRFFEPNPD